MEHRLTTLASTPTSRVERCSCGAIHLTVAGTTIRIPEGTARELRHVLGAALGQLDAAFTTAPAPAAQMTLPSDDDDDSGPQIH